MRVIQSLGSRGWVAAAVFSLSVPAAGQITLRRPADDIDGRVAGVSAAGVRIELAQGAGVRVIGWDMVPMSATSVWNAPGASAFADSAERLWRARTRLERGDWLSAAAIFRQAVADSRGVAGPTPALVFEGQLRCELARGARLGAVEAWLDWSVVMERSAGPSYDLAQLPPEWIGGAIDARRVVDLRTGLVPALPPIWVGETALDAAATGGRWGELISSAAGSGQQPACPRALELIELYRAAAQHQAGGNAELPPASVGSVESPGTRLVRLIVEARAGDESRRHAARDGLQAMLSGPETPDWIAAWCRAGLGRSLLIETRRDDRIRGVIELLHVPAMYGGVTPDLAAVALADAAVAMWDLNDRSGAAAIKLELMTTYPNHPALQWRDLDRVRIEAGRPKTDPSVRAEVDR